MFFFFVCGSQDFNSTMKGYENVRIVCPWGHHAIPIKRRTFFTFCFIPLVPIGSSQELVCTVCQYRQTTDSHELESMVHHQQQVPPPQHMAPQGQHMQYPPPATHQPPQYK